MKADKTFTVKSLHYGPTRSKNSTPTLEDFTGGVAHYKEERSIIGETIRGYLTYRSYYLDEEFPEQIAKNGIWVDAGQTMTGIFVPAPECEKAMLGLELLKEGWWLA